MVKLPHGCGAQAELNAGCGGSCDVGDGWLNSHRTDLLTAEQGVHVLAEVKRCQATLLMLLSGLHDADQNTGLSPEVALRAWG